MSKSLGNGIDPMEVIDKYGCDSLRFFLTTNSTPGQDLRFITEKVEAAWNFINKIWNASRFVCMNLDADFSIDQLDLSQASMIDKWILKRLNETIESVSANMDKYEFALVGNELTSFVWDDFCSWYIELCKANLNSEDAAIRNAVKSTLVTVLSAIVRLLHPFMPFVTEEIYLSIPHRFESINLETWPNLIDVAMSDEEMSSVNELITMIQAVREIKTAYNLKPSADVNIIVKAADGTLRPCDDKINAILNKMCHAFWINEDSSEEVVTRTILNGTLSIQLSDVINVEEEIAKCEKEIERLKKEIARAEGMLANPNFTNKAPAAKVDAEREKLAGYTQQLALNIARLEGLKK